MPSLYKPQPVGVSVIAILLLFGSLFSILSVVNVYTSALPYALLEESTRSLPIAVFLMLANAGLSLACGIGMLGGHNWARLLYIGYVPAFIFMSAVNGLHLTLVVTVIQYVIFLFILTRRDCRDYFVNLSH